MKKEGHLIKPPLEETFRKRRGIDPPGPCPPIMRNWEESSVVCRVEGDIPPWRTGFFPTILYIEGFFSVITWSRRFIKDFVFQGIMVPRTEQTVLVPVADF